MSRSGAKAQTLRYLSAIIVLGITAAQAQTPTKLKRLQGLPPIEVFVYQPKSGNNADSYDPSAIRTGIELKLRQNGIRVLPAEDSITYPRAVLHIEIIASWNSARTSRIYAFEITLKQDIGLGMWAQLWRYGLTIGSMGETLSFPDRVKERVLEGVDAFLNDYLAANPNRSR